MTRDAIIKLGHAAGLCDENGEDDSSQDITEALRRMAVLVIANHPPESWMSFQEGYAAGAAYAREESAQAARIAMLGTEWPLTERVMRAIRASGQR